MGGIPLNSPNMWNTQQVPRANYQLPTNTPIFETPQPASHWGGDITYFLLSFIIFSVAFAVVRNLFNRLWSRIPEKNWKADFKNKVNKFNRKLDEKKVNMPDAKEKFIDPESRRLSNLANKKDNDENNNQPNNGQGNDDNDG